MFGLKRPCAECPFRKGDGAVRLTRARAREVAGYFVNVDERRVWTGGTFPCHKTVPSDDEDEDDGGSKWLLGEWQLCAGGMLFADKHSGDLPQIMQLGIRLGMITLGDMEGIDDVVDTLDELLALSFKNR